MFTLTREPQSLTRLTAGSGELAQLAGQVSARLNWPGKPAPRIETPRLTPEEESRIAAGAQIYGNYCAGCHRADGQGQGAGPTNLTASQLVGGATAAVVRVVLSGKEGSAGLMPPLGATLNDEQIASVASYIRRAWGRTGSTLTAPEVKEIRGQTSLRKTPWTDAELARYTAGRGGRGGNQ
jgi:mono/diheme cytochrome c family protein